MADGRDLYKVLQVDPEADPDVIQAAYRRLAQKYHPDLAEGDAAAERMIQLNGAWEILRDPGRRAAYDLERARWLARQAASARTAAEPRSGPDPGAPGADSGHGPGTGAASQGAHRTQRSGTGWPVGGEAPPPGSKPGEPASRNWTSGRSTVGGGYDPRTMSAPDGYGAAGRPPGKPSGSVLNFGRYAGWSLGEVARQDLEYLEWLERSPIGRQYRDEVDGILRKAGRRRPGGDDADRRGLFRR